MPWAFGLLGVPLVMLLVECLRGAYCDMEMIRTVALRSEMGQMRSQAVHRASRLETLVEEHHSADRPWSVLVTEQWLKSFWSALRLDQQHQLYAAMVDPAGTIVMHSDPTRVGQQLSQGWYERRESAAGADVVYLSDGPLNGKSAAYDVAVPLRVAGEWGGDFHEGLDAEWFNSHVQNQQRDVFVKWSWLLSVVLIAEIGAVWAITYLVRVLRGLRLAVQRGAQHRRRELAQIGSGLAHEIRNPLHSLRINLHLLRRSFGGHSPLGEDQRAATLQDCESAIERLVALMQDLVHFSHPHEGEPTQIDLGREVQATLNLLTEDLRRARIEIHAQLTGEPIAVAIDPARLRHLVLTLITFARERAGKEGTIEVELHCDTTQAVLAVADSGPPLTTEERARIFEPFQTPAAVGSGLGLALVQVYAEEAGGQVTCLHRKPAGTRFCLSLPLVPPASQESHRDTQA